ncbi:DOPA 4,5-dioxygenase [Marinobacterium mangrovicola]|uniref:DOPA 4,5-dioxygenase n=2 Tax=Marinobacterium mangrovicola TaxID=1476959 RepID=A0A4R1GP97_9GAMM|nr:DOPA 4,5-dioxygenase [Marinobacterium mangrovicola]
MSEMPVIRSYHAHVYYDADSFEQARELCEGAVAKFGIPMGRMHQKPVGPHPDWSCQLTVATCLIGEVIGWLTLNRKGLNVFVHPDTGDDLRDHRDRAIWLGEDRPLKLDQFYR